MRSSEFLFWFPAVSLLLLRYYFEETYFCNMATIFMIVLYVMLSINYFFHNFIFSYGNPFYSFMETVFSWIFLRISFLKVALALFSAFVPWDCFFCSVLCYFSSCSLPSGDWQLFFRLLILLCWSQLPMTWI